MWVVGEGGSCFVVEFGTLEECVLKVGCCVRAKLDSGDCGCWGDGVGVCAPPFIWDGWRTLCCADGVEGGFLIEGKVEAGDMIAGAYFERFGGIIVYPYVENATVVGVKGILMDSEVLILPCMWGFKIPVDVGR